MKKIVGLQALSLYVMNVMVLISIQMSLLDVSEVIVLLWIILTVPIYFLVRKNNKALFLYVLLNSAVSGLAISLMYHYGYMNEYNGLVIMFIGSGVLLLVYIIGANSESVKAVCKGLLIISVIGLLVSLFLWLGKGVNDGVSFMFLSITLITFQLGILLAKEPDKNILKIFGKASLFVFGSVVFVVIVILSEGDILEIDVTDMLFGKRKKGRNSH